MPAATTTITPTPAATTTGLVIEMSKESEVDGGGGGGGDEDGESGEQESVPSEPEVQMFPFPRITAASLVPSLEEVMLYHCFVAPTDVSSVHVAPESVEAQMLSLIHI